MEEAEKMEALKRAYADIILNTAKEAAARILVSERKALCFQKDLFSSKEDALNMLLRLKQIMDSRIAEAEKTSLDQKRKVQKLEAQLNEAKNTVNDLRTELRRAHDELDKMKIKLVEPLNEQTVNGQATFHENARQGNKLGTTDSIVFPVVSEPGLVLSSGLKDATLNDLPSDKCYASKPDLPSIIMRSKEPELYRNGCTQRIRAFEQNLLTGKLPLPGETDDGYSHVKNELMVIEDEIETSEQACTVASPKVDNVVAQAENLTALKETLHQDTSCEKGPVKFFRRCSSRRGGQCKPIKTPGALPDQVTGAHEPSNVPLSKNSPFSCVDMIESDENLLATLREDPEKDLNSCFVPSSTEISKISKDSLGVSSKDENRACDNKMLTEELTLTGEEYEVADNTSDDSICKLNHETVDVPSANPDNKDEKTCEAIEATIQAVNDRPLKYTFRRKRKREPLSAHKDDAVNENKSTSKRRTGGKQSAMPDLQKSGPVMESSRDSRRLFQVARQLISLSEKRWW
ncbi:uncharacterized protein LOC143878265 isoform X2 [Tasmannia lanceolata]|uniref:uncharacterized protein LOC143878265 isoform X2 n=1 Tax=Tasmannia lanceolata TaxID=3420 RepID=UPI004062A689